MRIFDKATDKYYEVMQYTFRVTDEFIKFVGIKSFREENLTTSAMVDGKNKEDNYKRIKFTFDGYDDPIQMEDGYWFGKADDGDWKVFTNETIENESGISVVSDETEENKEKILMDKLMTSRDSFMWISVNLVDLINANLQDYAYIYLADEDVKIYEETKVLCDKLRNNLKHLGGFGKDEQYLDLEDLWEENDG